MISRSDRASSIGFYRVGTPGAPDIIGCFDGHFVGLEVRPLRENYPTIKKPAANVFARLEADTLSSDRSTTSFRQDSDISPVEEPPLPPPVHALPEAGTPASVTQP
jgi:hypothetical protein